MSRSNNQKLKILYLRDILYRYTDEAHPLSASEIAEMLKDMGMDLPFDMAAADFTDMMEPVDVDGNQIWLGRVLHKTHIEVDRVGTRAAAVTAIEVEAVDSCEEYEEPVMIILDRPFIYGIIDNETGLPVFLGCVNTL